MIAREGDDAAEFRIEALEALEIDAGQPLGGELAVFDPAREVRDRREGDVFVARGQRAGIGGGAHEAVAIGTGGLAGLNRLNAGPGLKVGLERDFARSGAAFVERRHGFAPVGGGLGAVFLGHLDADELFGFGESRGGDFRTNGRRGSKGGRCAGRWRLLGFDTGDEVVDDSCGEQAGRRADQKTAARSIHAHLRAIWICGPIWNIAQREMRSAWIR